MKNISKEEVFIGSSVAPLWKSFEIDLRDAAGKEVPETEAGRNLRDPRQLATSRNVPITLNAGQTKRTVVILNRLYDLTQPGTYKLQVQRADFNAKSNIVNFRIPQLPVKQSRPSVSIKLTPIVETLPAGWKLPVRAAIKNVSKQALRLALWEGVSRETSWTLAAQEFGSGVEVSDSHKEPVPPSNDAHTFFTRGGWAEGHFLMIPIPPGEVYENTVTIGELATVSNPGHYSVRMTLADPSGLLVSSNTVSFEVNGTAQTKDGSQLKPPFVVTIRVIEDTADAHIPLLICMTNISNYQIRLDNAITQDSFAVRDRLGMPVTMTESGEYIRRSFGGGASHTTHSVPPGESLCGGISLGVLFKFGKPGRYAVQVGHVAEASVRPDDKSQTVPVEKSNIIFVTAGG